MLSTGAGLRRQRYIRGRLPSVKCDKGLVKKCADNRLEAVPILVSPNKTTLDSKDPVDRHLLALQFDPDLKNAPLKNDPLFGSHHFIKVPKEVIVIVDNNKIFIMKDNTPVILLSASNKADLTVSVDQELNLANLMEIVEPDIIELGRKLREAKRTIKVLDSHEYDEAVRFEEARNYLLKKGETAEAKALEQAKASMDEKELEKAKTADIAKEKEAFKELHRSLAQKWYKARDEYDNAYLEISAILDSAGSSPSLSHLAIQQEWEKIKVNFQKENKMMEREKLAKAKEEFDKVLGAFQEIDKRIEREENDFAKKMRIHQKAVDYALMLKRVEKICGEMHKEACRISYETKRVTGLYCQLYNTANKKIANLVRRLRIRNSAVHSTVSSAQSAMGASSSGLAELSLLSHTVLPESQRDRGDAKNNALIKNV